ncbi:MAG: hypothetical protein ACOH5I_11695 [Oligoflexus sp.]
MNVACGLGSQGENFTTEFAEAGKYTFVLDRRSDEASLTISKDP